MNWLLPLPVSVSIYHNSLVLKTEAMEHWFHLKYIFFLELFHIFICGNATVQFPESLGWIWVCHSIRTGLSGGDDGEE